MRKTAKFIRKQLVKLSALLAEFGKGAGYALSH
ncbi:hypothetical protein SAMN04489761_4314 [Tenacibaculum sp. MAR_2009_124]|nr:hypothetical protein SAMN04489761_4314 [Tenacibaculum sp. MAR_2009_124]